MSNVNHIRCHEGVTEKKAAKTIKPKKLKKGKKWLNVYQNQK